MKKQRRLVHLVVSVSAILAAKKNWFATPANHTRRVLRKGVRTIGALGLDRLRKLKDAAKVNRMTLGALGRVSSEAVTILAVKAKLVIGSHDSFT